MASEHLGMKVDVKMDATGISAAPLSVGSLVETLIETLHAANDLHRCMRKKIKSFESDTEVRITRKDKKPVYKRRDSSSSSSSDNGRHRKRDWHKRVSRSRSKSKKRDSSSSDSDDETVSITKLVIQVRAEYDHGCKRLGEKFTIGDLRAHNILQAQIIVVQQSMLLVYRDSSLYDGFSRYPLTYFVAKLTLSCTTARTCTIEALTHLHQHLLHPLHPHPPSHEPDPPRIPGAYPIHILPIDPIPNNNKNPNKRRTSVTISHSHMHQTTTAGSPSSSSDPTCTSNTSTTLTSVSPTRGKSLFCPYALDLQRDPARPLSDSYKLPTGDNRCPFCKFHIHTKPGRAWEVILDDKISRRDRRCRFLITNRFVVKCHGDGGGFACVLCRRWSDGDTVMRGVEELVDHVWREHGVGEVRGDGDIFEG